MIKVDPDEHILINFLDLDMGKNGNVFNIYILTFAMFLWWSMRTLNQIGQIENVYYLSIRRARLFDVIEDI